MTNEEKQLLLKDLCARLPYGVMCQMEDEIRFIGEKSPYYDYILSERHIELLKRHKDFNIKPYLRPMSSMTEEEDKIYTEISMRFCGPLAAKTMIDWCNANHFDYRGLIEKGLALEAPEGMYK